MKITWSQPTRPHAGGAHVRLVSQTEDDTADVVDTITGLSKTVGRVMVDGTADAKTAHFLASVGTGSIKDCVAAGRKLVTAFAKTDFKHIAIDVSALTSVASALTPKPALVAAFARGLKLGVYQLKQWAQERAEEVLPETAIVLYQAAASSDQEAPTSTQNLADHVSAAVAVGAWPTGGDAPRGSTRQCEAAG